MRRCPRNDPEGLGADCSCITDLGDRVFRRKTVGGDLGRDSGWCSDVTTIAAFVDRVLIRNQELYDILRAITSSPVEVSIDEHTVSIHPLLWKKAIEVVNGGFK